nr:ABC transporter substrate-binding protein [Caldimonas sp.]
MTVPSRRRRFLAAAAGAVAVSLVVPGARGQSRLRRIGVLSGFARADMDSNLNLLRQELEKLGWFEGRNITILEPRAADGINERLPALAADLLGEAPDVIVVLSTPATRAAMQASQTVPVVMAGVGNPVENGLVPSLRHPGANVTGSTFLADESIRKLLQLLKEAAPRLQSVAFFVNPTNVAARPLLGFIRVDAPALGLRPQIVEVSSPADFAPGFDAILRERTESILSIPEPLIVSNRAAIGEFAQRHRFPLAVVGRREVMPAGALIAYAPANQYPQLTARYVDQILKGAKPGELAVEQPSRFELLINMKTANALGLSIPQSILLVAEVVG